MNHDPVLSPQGPWIHPLVAAESEAYDLAWGLQRAHGPRVACRVIRGRKARTIDGLFDEFAAALQFPYYFGENWDALEECLTDLEWLPANAYVLVINHSLELLDKEPPGRLSLFFRLLQRVAEEWSRPGRAPTPRPPKAFHVLLQCTHETQPAMLERFATADVSFSCLA
jgi:hypothetical protein